MASCPPVAQALACRISILPLCIAFKRTPLLSRAAKRAHLSMSIANPRSTSSDCFSSESFLSSSASTIIRCQQDSSPWSADGIERLIMILGIVLATFHLSAVRISIFLLIPRLFDLLHLEWLALRLLLKPCGFRGSIHTRTQLLGLLSSSAMAFSHP